MSNGSEKLNALEITKRMAWVYGGVGESLGIKIELIEESPADDEAKELEIEEQADQNDSAKAAKNIDYQQLIRFPNLSSIATARFVCESPELTQTYWINLKERIKEHKSEFS
jgi:CRISPR-associated protein Cmr2